MNKEDKEFLIKEISNRLPYDVKAQVVGWNEEKGEEVEIPLKVYSINTDGYVYFEPNDYDVNYLPVDACLLFLRPMSSMTEEEKEELLDEFCVEIRDEDNGRHKETYGYVIVYHNFNGESWFIPFCAFDWLNAHHFDYRSLIEKGLAIEATEENNPYKE